MQVNILLFPHVVPLDVIGPYEVLSRVPGWRVEIVARSSEAIPTDKPLLLLPTATWDDAANADLLVVPGGSGVDDIICDRVWVRYVADQAAQASYILGVCTGSLLLGAAGVLHSKKATTHWMVRDLLPAFGATAVNKRVVRDGNVFTAAGVTAGIDAALSLVGDLEGVAQARTIQLAMEYDPAPPYVGGSPANTPTAILEAVRRSSAAKRKRREQLVTEAATLLSD